MLWLCVLCYLAGEGHTHTWTYVAAQMGGSREAENVMLPQDGRDGTEELAGCSALTDNLARKISESAIYIKGICQTYHAVQTGMCLLE